ncbi:MAG: NUDIX hydrolase [Candidatus Protochlamydia sp.]|nr:NUDIX hydrolase [Candidatus Protochlamydia sp.]
MSDKPFTYPEIDESKVVFQESLIRVSRDILRLKNGTPYSYYSLNTYPYAVIILATNLDGYYILNQEYRHPTGQFLLSCPGGYIDKDEDPIEAAKRELEEETGYQALTFELIGSAYPYAGISSQKTIYVRAKEAVKKTAPRLDTCEIIQTKLLSPKELDQAISEGKNLDGTLCTALFFNQRNIL